MISLTLCWFLVAVPVTAYYCLLVWYSTTPTEPRFHIPRDQKFEGGYDKQITVFVVPAIHKTWMATSIIMSDRGHLPWWETLGHPVQGREFWILIWSRGQSACTQALTTEFKPKLMLQLSHREPVTRVGAEQ